MKRRLLLAGSASIAVLATTGLTACGSDGLSSGRLEASLGSAFGNLYVLQQHEQGHSTPALTSLRARASCQKGTQDIAQHGAGNDWLCQVTYLVAGPATPVTARYNVTLQTDGCYAADGDGPTSVNGSRTITDAAGRQRVNPLWLINGCFDPS